MYLGIPTQKSCARAWVAAASAMIDAGEGYNVVVDVAEPVSHDDKDNEVITFVDKFLRLHDEHPIITVSNTIFPQSLYDAHGSPDSIDPSEVVTPQPLRVMQIIAGTLLMGVVVFLAVVLFIVQMQGNGQGMAPAGGLPILSLIAVVMFALCAPLAFIVPGVQTRLALRQIVTGKWPKSAAGNSSAFASARARLMAVRQTTMIVGLALLEGPAFLGCLAYMVEAQALALGLVGLTVVLMLFKFPTEGRVRAWLERQTDVLAELRQQREFATER